MQPQGEMTEQGLTGKWTKAVEEHKVQEKNRHQILYAPAFFAQVTCIFKEAYQAHMDLMHAVYEDESPSIHERINQIYSNEAWNYVASYLDLAIDESHAYYKTYLYPPCGRFLLELCKPFQPPILPASVLMQFTQ